MYNAHRGGGMGQPPANNSNSRLSELFEQIRREFDVHAQDRAGEHDQSSMFFFLGISELCARLHALLKPAFPKCLINTNSARDWISFIYASPSPAHTVEGSRESWNAASTLEEKADSNETIVAAQMQEMEMVRQKVYELERNQIQIKQRYVVSLVA